MKRCCGCKENKPLEGFHRSSSSSDGRQGHCKPCKRLMGRKYDANRSAKKSIYNKSQWKKRKNDPEYQRKHQEWLDKNRDRVRKKAAEYRENNRLLLLVSRSNQRAKEKGVVGKIRMVEWQAALEETGFMCIACEEEPANTIDHVVPLINGGANDYTNIQPMCLRCNLKKGTRSVDFRTEGFSERIQQKCAQ